MAQTNKVDCDAIDNVIDEHFRRLRTHIQYRNCMNRVYMEANMSFVDTDRLAKKLHSNRDLYGNVHVVSFDPKKKGTGGGRFGIWTTHDSKVCYAEEIRRCMAHMRFADKYIGTPDNWQINRTELFKQLGQFRKEIIVPANTENNSQLFFKVNITGKSTGEQDDMVMALGICLYYMFRAQSDDSFLALCDKLKICAF